MEKTNAMRILEAAGIAYVPHEYDPEIVNGEEVALALGEDKDRVFKTLVCVSSDGQYYVFDVPVRAELDLKKAARACKAKAVELIPYKKLLPLTGYVHGGCSPVGLKKPFPVFIDETAMLFDTIFVSGGKRGMQMEVSPMDLSSYLNAPLVDLTRG